METQSTHITTEAFEAALAKLLDSPRDAGLLEMIVARLPKEKRRTCSEVYLSPDGGLAGDRWLLGKNGRAPDPRAQVSLMNARVLRLIAGEEDRMPLVGDNLIVDLDLSEVNIPIGQRLAVGEAILEVTDKPHTGCSKFNARYGKAALQFINAPERKELHLRGIYARVVQAGVVRLGDKVHKIEGIYS
ncbi:MOSC domain-containing protein [Gloeobacter violaceus]|nr:MOSC domain-containing protein [Gloeobacter violaceus]